MVEIVFCESAKGSMKCGQRFTSGTGGASAIGVIGSGTGQPSREAYDAVLSEAKRRLERELRCAKPLGGRPEDVLGLSFALDIGDIASPVTDTPRKELIARMLGADPWGALQGMEDSVNRYWDSCVSDLNQLMARATAGEPVRIWYSDAPYSICGFHDTINRLKNCECRITAIKLPACIPLGEREAKSVMSWGEISPGEYAHYLPLEFEIPKSVQMAVAMEWEILKRENASLRVMLNGKLHSVEMDFYDRFIRSEIPDSTFKIAQLIGLVLGRNQLGIGDWIIARRIKNMIESGELTVIQKDSAFYGTTLKRAVSEVELKSSEEEK